MEVFLSDYKRYMTAALDEARSAYDKGEVPIGAVIVRCGKIIARGHNLRETDGDPTAHAEIIAIRNAAQFLGGWRLTGCEIYVTIEPCPMCAGAILSARMDRVIYGAADIKAGCAGTLYNILDDDRFNHKTEVVFGIMEDECRDIIRDFFASKRDGLRQRRKDWKKIND